ncbi:hypothetical protein Plhal703r1_c06g0034301 [Plasmopara halstedii]
MRLAELCPWFASRYAYWIQNAAQFFDQFKTLVFFLRKSTLQATVTDILEALAFAHTSCLGDSHPDLRALSEKHLGIYGKVQAVKLASDGHLYHSCDRLTLPRYDKMRQEATLSRGSC